MCSVEEGLQIGWHGALPVEMLFLPGDVETGGVECMAGEKKTGCKIRCPTELHPLEVFRAIAGIDFITNDGMTGGGEVDSDLVHPPGSWKAANHGEITPVAAESMFDGESCVACPPVWMANLPYPNLAEADL